MSRLPAERSLANILPYGTEGGKEFARIIDLLLFYDARKNGVSITLFSDRSGDTYGLDAFDNQYNGYQYKFYPSPLSNEHRAEIIKSIKSADSAYNQSKIKKWIIVTPDDLVNSGRKKGGGDVEWFSTLRSKMGIRFEIEHFGHTKIQALFLQTESLCLHYYPSIIPNGLRRQNAIQLIRKQYDDNLRRRYSHIEFVGMSVRKEDATRGLPMERIYIPLETVAEGTTDNDNKAIRSNPLEYVEKGRRTVILGDPGTGKSTLLHFLALSGISQKLQQRYAAAKDDRLALIVTLRRYADALKTNINIPIIDYISDTIKADFSIPDFSSDFIRFHLEVGRVILLFDGIDELPDLSYKALLRERVQSIVTSYPGNTAIVTSRIAGYDAEARFSGVCDFEHRQMAPLREPEMRRFAQDWHAARTENEKDRERYVAELMRILTDVENQPIRELARNPLLLTIMVLVHRIDAMLPDERVVLYQKCVETLVVSWQARKAQLETRRPGKDRTDQQNLRRLAAIAQWMHEQADSGDAERRAVVSRADLVVMLCDHIRKVERCRDEDYKIESDAEQFLQFVRERAGLLIEVGTDLYSFIHLTFQEYLTAYHITVLSEVGGDAFIWEKLRPLITNPRWREVIRLLVAERKSEESKRTLTGHILNAGKCAQSSSDRSAIAALAGGLLIDRIPAAIERASDIMEGLLVAVAACDEDGSSTSPALLTQLATLLNREENAASCWDEAVAQALEGGGSNQRMRAGIVLAAFTVPLPAERVRPLMGILEQVDSEAAAVAECLLWGASQIPLPGQIPIQRLHSALYYYAIKSPNTNFLSSIVASQILADEGKTLAYMMAGASLVALMQGGDGPLMHICINSAYIYKAQLWCNGSDIYRKRILAHIDDVLQNGRDQALFGDVSSILKSAKDRALDRFLVRNPNLAHELGLEREALRDAKAKQKGVRTANMILTYFQNRALERYQNKFGSAFQVEYLNQIESRVLMRDREKAMYIRQNFHSILTDDRVLQDSIIEIILIPLDMPMKPIWREALRRRFVPNILNRHVVFRPEYLKRVTESLKNDTYNNADIYGAFCWLMLDMIVGQDELARTMAANTLIELEGIAQSIKHPILRFVTIMRQISSNDKASLKELLNFVDHPPAGLGELFVEFGLM